MAQAMLDHTFYSVLNERKISVEKSIVDGPPTEKDKKICPVKTCRKECNKSNYFR
jgi:hypothetical protein